MEPINANAETVIAILKDRLAAEIMERTIMESAVRDAHQQIEELTQRLEQHEGGERK